MLLELMYRPCKTISPKLSVPLAAPCRLPTSMSIRIVKARSGLMSWALHLLLGERRLLWQCLSRYRRPRSSWAIRRVWHRLQSNLSPLHQLPCPCLLGRSKCFRTQYYRHQRTNSLLSKDSTPHQPLRRFCNLDRWESKCACRPRCQVPRRLEKCVGFKVATSRRWRGDRIASSTVEIDCASMRAVQSVRRDRHGFALRTAVDGDARWRDVTKALATRIFVQRTAAESGVSKMDVQSRQWVGRIGVRHMVAESGVPLTDATNRRSRRRVSVSSMAVAKSARTRDVTRLLVVERISARRTVVVFGVNWKAAIGSPLENCNCVERTEEDRGNERRNPALHRPAMGLPPSIPCLVGLDWRRTS